MVDEEVPENSSVDEEAAHLVDKELAAALEAEAKAKGEVAAGVEDEDKTPTSKRKRAKKPKVGDDVEYVYSGMHIPGTITEVFDDGTATVQAANNSIVASPIEHSLDHAENTFHYPEE